MTPGLSTSQNCLVLGFAAFLFGMPLSQIAVEVYRGGPVQCTDLCRRAPIVENLREYERALEDNWWGQTTIRPKMQGFLFSAVRDTGPKAVAGRNGWMFYRPGLQYLTQANRSWPENEQSVPYDPATRAARPNHVVQAIVAYRDQLKRRGIELLVVPVPGKASVYPECLTSRLAGKTQECRSPTEDLLLELGQRGVETVDLFTAFREARRIVPRPMSGGALYLKQDTHWTPAGARVAAKAVAEKLRELNWAPESPWEYATEPVRVARRGDVLEMMQIPGVREFFQPDMVECERVLDNLTGPLLPQVASRDGTFKNAHLIDTPFESSLLLLGDSFCRIYQFAEPASLGEQAEPSPNSRSGTPEISSEAAESERGVDPNGAARTGAAAREHGQQAHTKKRLLPGSAGFPSLLAQQLRAPVDIIASDGGAATDVRQRLNVDPEILDNKKVVIWEFAERDIHLGMDGWLEVPLPPEL